MIDKGIILNELKITASNYFIINKKNGEEEKIHTIKNNLFSLTPNFENAQKVGILLKYKSGFFSSSSLQYPYTSGSLQAASKS